MTTTSNGCSVMSSVVQQVADYPFERMEDASDWFDATTTISPEDKRRIGRTNAIELFKLDLR